MLFVAFNLIGLFDFSLQNANDCLVRLEKRRSIF